MCLHARHFQTPKGDLQRSLDMDVVLAHFPIDPNKVKQVSGNASYEAKEIAYKWLAVFLSAGEGFSGNVASRVRIMEASIIQNPEEPDKLESRVVCEIDVEEDMLNPLGNLHGGCSIFLIDECSTLPLSVLLHSLGRPTSGGVSQTINTTFHAPAPLGTKIRLVNTSMIIEEPMLCTRSEVWDVDNHRLISSAVQTKMLPSQPKPKL
ncbi:Thioesterase domain-containing protein [Pleurotus pulmonarius]